MKAENNNRFPAVILVLIVAMAALFAGCGEDQGECTGRGILPSRSPVDLGSLFPAPDDRQDWNTATLERSPYEYVLLLQAECEPVEIKDVCLAGAADATNKYILETEGQSKTTTIGPGSPTALRVTYQREDPGGPDQVAVVVQSNSDTFPTLVIPLCAQVLPEFTGTSCTTSANCTIAGSNCDVAAGLCTTPRQLVECASPVTAENAAKLVGNAAFVCQ